MALGNEIVEWMEKNDLVAKDAALFLNVELETLRGWIYKGHEPSAVELVRARMREFKSKP